MNPHLMFLIQGVILLTAPSAERRTPDGVRTLISSPKELWKCEYLPDHKRLLWVTADSRAVRLLSGKQSRVLFETHSDIRSIAVVPGQRLIVGHYNGSLTLWNLKTRQRIALVKKHEGIPSCVVCSPCGRRLLVADGTNAETSIIVWNLDPLKPFRALKYRGSNLMSAAFSPDGKLIAATDIFGEVYIWNIETGALKNQFQASKLATLGLAFVGKSSIAVGCSTGVSVFSLPNAKRLYDFKTSDLCTAMTYSEKLKLLVFGTADGFVSVVDIKTGKKIQHVRIHRKHVTSFQISEQGMVTSSSWDGTIREWAIRKKSPRPGAKAGVR